MKVSEDRSGFAVTTNTTSSTVTALVFLTSAVATVYLCRSMAAAMPMPGGWSMSMAWMRMPGQSWAAAAAMFLAMWTVMMIAMMLPAIAPTKPPLGYAAGYFAVWAAAGLVVYPIGIALATAEMRSPAVSRAVPVAAAIAIIVAGLVQLSPWKMRALSCCRAPARSGLRAGIDCVVCCCGLMTVLLVVGVMNLIAMIVIAAAIAIERFAPRPQLAARIAGVAIVAYGTAQLIH